MAASETNGNPEQPNDQASESNSRRKRGIAALLALLVFILAACCWIASTQMVEVPDVIGMTETEARDALEEAGFEIEVDGSADGVAVSQIPEGGRRALKGTRVIVTFDGAAAADDVVSTSADTGSSSLGTDGYTPSGSGDGTDGYIPGGSVTSADNRPLIPMVGNTPEASAVSTLRNAGYRVVIGGYGPTTTVATGNVYFQEPAFGSRGASGSTVTLWISSGAPHENGYQGVPYPSPTN